MDGWALTAQRSAAHPCLPHAPRHHAPHTLPWPPQRSKTVDREEPGALPEGVVMEGAEFRRRVLNEDGTLNSGGATS